MKEMLAVFRKVISGLALDGAVSRRVARGVVKRRSLHSPERLEARQVFAILSGPGRDTNDPYMEPQRKVGDEPNPQWNMERMGAYTTWGVYTGTKASVVAVQDYGVDFRHEDLGASQATPGNLWDYGKIHSTNSDYSFTISKRGRDDFSFPVHVPLEDMPSDWNDRTRPKSGQYFGNISAGIIGAATSNKIGVAGINWETQIYSAEVIIDDTTDHDYIAVRSNRVIQWLRAGITNPDHQEIRAVSFGYSSARDYGDIFNFYAPAPEPYSAAGYQPQDGGHYDFISLGRGISGMPGRDATWGILVTVPTGDWNKTWPLRNPQTGNLYYQAGSWGRGRGSAGGYSPGSVDNIIAVAATDINDRPWIGNARNPIDIYAPGVDIWSLSEQGNSYSMEDGTRQAQAHVAGAIALIYDAAKQHGVTLTYHQVREAIIEGGDNVGLDRPRLNVAGSLKYLNLHMRPVPNRTGVAISGGAGLEGNAGTTAAQFTLTLTKAVSIPTTILVGIQDGTARRADHDFVLPRGGQVRVVIPAGQAQATFTVNIFGDSRVEGDETLTARIMAVPENVTSGYGASATWTIINDDVGPSVSLLGTSASEGSARRPGTAQVLVKLDKPSPRPVTVQYSLVSGSAVAGTDFQAEVGRVLTIPAGHTSAPILVRLVGNDTAGVDRNFQVRIDSVVNAMLPTSLTARAASVTIIDDDPPVVTSRPGSVRAAASATTLVIFVQMSKAATEQVSVNFSTRDGSGARAAVAGDDYTALAGTVVFNAGETLKRIEVTVLPRRAGQRYPKDLFIDFTGTSDNAALKTGWAGRSVIGRIS